MRGVFWFESKKITIFEGTTCGKIWLIVHFKDKNKYTMKYPGQLNLSLSTQSLWPCAPINYSSYYCSFAPGNLHYVVLLLNVLKKRCRVFCGDLVVVVWLVHWLVGFL